MEYPKPTFFKMHLSGYCHCIDAIADRKVAFYIKNALMWNKT
jgi:hypothetical protein